LTIAAALDGRACVRCAVWPSDWCRTIGSDRSGRGSAGPALATVAWPIHQIAAIQPRRRETVIMPQCCRPRLGLAPVGLAISPSLEWRFTNRRRCLEARSEPQQRVSNEHSHQVRLPPGVSFREDLLEMRSRRIETNPDLIRMFHWAELGSLPPRQAGDPGGRRRYPHRLVGTARPLTASTPPRAPAAGLLFCEKPPGIAPAWLFRVPLPCPPVAIAPWPASRCTATGILPFGAS
jgi:hypothetical protein